MALVMGVIARSITAAARHRRALTLGLFLFLFCFFCLSFLLVFVFILRDDLSPLAVGTCCVCFVLPVFSACRFISVCLSLFSLLALSYERSKAAGAPPPVLSSCSEIH